MYHESGTIEIIISGFPPFVAGGTRNAGVDTSPAHLTTAESEIPAKQKTAVRNDDLLNSLLTPFFLRLTSLPARVLILAAGCVILAFGMTIVIKSDAGTGPNDLVAVVISDRLHRKFSVVRIIVDVCFVAVGWLLGGTFGLGTIICAALVGPVAGIFLPRSEMVIERLVRRAL